MLCRFVDSLGYFGLSLQVGDFGLDIYLTQLIFGAVEVPARYSSIFMMQWFGRRWSQMGTLVLGGLMCISIIFVPAGAWPGSPRPRPPSLSCGQRPMASLSGTRASPGLSVWVDRAGSRAQGMGWLPSVWLTSLLHQTCPSWAPCWPSWGNSPRRLDSPSPTSTLLSSSPPSSGKGCWHPSPPSSAPETLMLAIPPLPLPPSTNGFWGGSGQPCWMGVKESINIVQTQVVQGW